MRRFAVVAVALAVTACSALGRAAFQNPVVNLRDVRVLGLGTQGGNLEVQLGVYNPNNFRLDATRLTSSAGQLTDSARAIRQQERRLQDLSQSGVAHLRESVSALDALASDVGTNAEELAALAEASAEIRSFVLLVRKMARQSKLLALNAAMEAARAGEQGSGFAVVAGEVRRLARSSNDAADRTDQLVSDVLERVERVRQASLRAVDSSQSAREAAASSVASLRDRIAADRARLEEIARRCTPEHEASARADVSSGACRTAPAALPDSTNSG